MTIHYGRRTSTCGSCSTPAKSTRTTGRQDEFRHADLLKWAREARGELIWAALALARSWVAKGRPPGRETMGSYEGWAKVMGGILHTAGIPGLLANREEQRDAGESERDQMITFLDAWYSAHGSVRIKASEVDADAWRVLGIDSWGERAAVAMGCKLKQYADRPFNGLVLRRAMHQKGASATATASASSRLAPQFRQPSRRSSTASTSTTSPHSGEPVHRHWRPAEAGHGADGPLAINTTYKRYGHLFDGHDAAMLNGLDAAHEAASNVVPLRRQEDAAWVLSERSRTFTSADRR